MAAVVYRVEDPLEQLQLRLRIRQLQHGRGGEETGAANRPRLGQTHEYLIRWQEKVANPVLSQSTRRRKGSSADDAEAKELSQRNFGVTTYTCTESFSAAEQERGEPLVRTAHGAAAPISQTALATIYATPKGLSAADRPHISAQATRHVITTQRRENTAKTFHIVGLFDVDVAGSSAVEIVLVSMRAVGSSLEMTPGFAAMDPTAPSAYVDDPEVVVADAVTGEKTLLGGALVTTRVVTPRGDVFEYVVENGSAVEADLVDTLLQDECLVDARALRDRRERVPSRAFRAHLPQRTGDVGLNLALEIVSTIGFEAEWLYVEYEIYVPRGWAAVSQNAAPDATPDGNGGSTIRGVAQVAAPSEWVKTSDGELMRAGASQLVRSRPRPPRRFFGESRSVTDPKCVPQALHPEHFAVVVVLSLVAATFAFSILVGPSYILFLLASVLLLAASAGLSPADASSAEAEVTNIAHIALPIDLYLEGPCDDADASDDSAPFDCSKRISSRRDAPTLYVAVSSRRSFARYNVEGYAFWRLPSKQGVFDTSLSTWKPLGRVTDQLQDFFLGGAHRLADLRYSKYAPDAWHADIDKRTESDRRTAAQSSFASKFGFVTSHTGGTVQLRCSVLELHPKPAFAPVLATKTGPDRGAIDAILTDLKRSLRTQSLADFDRDRTRSATDRAKELIAKLQAERDESANYRMGGFVSNADTFKTQGPPRPKPKALVVGKRAPTALVVGTALETGGGHEEAKGDAMGSMVPGDDSD